MRNKKILFLATQVKGHGGIPRFNRNFIKSLKNTTNTVKISSLNDQKAADLKGFDKNKVAFLFYLTKEILFNNFNILILGHLNLVTLAFIKKIKPKTKIVVILHGIEAWQKNDKKSKWFKYIDSFWAVSNYTDKTFGSLNQIPPNRRERIFNTIPDEWLQNNEENIYKPYFLTVTRLDKNEGYKGVDITLEAIKNIREELLQRKFKFYAVVSGNDVDRHKKLVKDYELTGIVEFKNNISDSSLRDLYKNCSFFILPSKGEGFGIVFLEAMLYSKACIGSLNCGTEDVIDNGVTGYLLEPTITSIEDKILDLINNPEKCKKMGQKGNAKLKEEFVFSKFQEKINQLLQECAE